MPTWHCQVKPHTHAHNDVNVEGAHTIHYTHVQAFWPTRRALRIGPEGLG